MSTPMLQDLFRQLIRFLWRALCSGKQREAELYRRIGSATRPMRGKANAGVRDMSAESFTEVLCLIFRMIPECRWNYRVAAGRLVCTGRPEHCKIRLILSDRMDRTGRKVAILDIETDRAEPLFRRVVFLRDKTGGRLQTSRLIFLM